MLCILCSFSSSFAIIIQPAAEWLRKEVGGEAPKREKDCFSIHCELCYQHSDINFGLFLRTVCKAFSFCYYNNFVWLPSSSLEEHTHLLTDCLFRNIFSWHHSHCNFSSLNTHWKAVCASLLTVFLGILLCFCRHCNLSWNLKELNSHRPDSCQFLFSSIFSLFLVRCSAGKIRLQFRLKRLVSKSPRQIFDFFKF